MLLHKNFILTIASWLLLAVSGHASMIVKQKAVDRWNRIFEDPNSVTVTADLSTALPGNYISLTPYRRELTARGVAALPDETSTFSVSITGANVRAMELIRSDPAATESVTHDPPPLALAATGLAILWVCGAAEPDKRRRRRHKKETAGDAAPAVGFTKEMIEA